jgi:thymidylate synthase (FAD)
VQTGNEYIDKLNHEHMTKLKALMSTFDIPNDIAKYSLVEAFMTSEQVSFNVRAHRHLLQLRGPESHALWEFKELAVEMYKALPTDWRIFYEDIEGLEG